MPHPPTWVLRFIEGDMFFNVTVFTLLVLGAITLINTGWLSRIGAFAFCLVCAFLFYGMSHTTHGFAVGLFLIGTCFLSLVLGAWLSEWWFAIALASLVACGVFKYFTGDPPLWTLGFSAFVVLCIITVGWHIFRPKPTTAHERTMAETPSRDPRLSSLYQAAAQAQMRERQRR